MIYLSYYSLNMIHNSLHQWVNKVAGVTQPEFKIWDKKKECWVYPLKEGKVGHSIIQKHVSGKTIDNRIAYITRRFPIVEEEDFDKRLNWRKYFTIKGSKYLVQGFTDGLDSIKNPKEMLEIKLSSSPWSVGKFQKSLQRKLYAWGFPSLKMAYLITGGRDPDEWATTPLKVKEVEITKEDAQEAEKWTMQAIERLSHLKEIIESRDKTTGLDENGKCNDYNCNYKENCLFL